MDFHPLPQRARKLRGRDALPSEPSVVESHTEAAAVAYLPSADAESTTVPHKRRIDAAEYFGVELALPARRDEDVVPAAFVEFEPHVTQFSFECTLRSLVLLA